MATHETSSGKKSIGQRGGNTTRSRPFRGLEWLRIMKACVRKTAPSVTLWVTHGLCTSKMMPRHHLIWWIICSRPNPEPAQVLSPRVEAGTDRQWAAWVGREDVCPSPPPAAHTRPLFKHRLPPRRSFKLVFTSDLHPSPPGFIQRSLRSKRTARIFSFPLSWWSEGPMS